MIRCLCSGHTYKENISILTQSKKNPSELYASPLKVNIRVVGHNISMRKAIHMAICLVCVQNQPTKENAIGKKMVLVRMVAKDLARSCLFALSSPFFPNIGQFMGKQNLSQILVTR